MANIPVEKKSNLTWLWIVIALLIVAFIAWWMIDSNDEVTALNSSSVMPTASLMDTNTRVASQALTLEELV